MKYIHLILVSFLLISCRAGDGSGLDENGQPLEQAEPDNSDSEIVQANLNALLDSVFVPICAQCHAGSQAPRGLQLDTADNVLNLTINVAAHGNPEFVRIAPGDPENSYLYLKITGDPRAGSRMPLGQAPLSEETIDAVYQWINSGAQPNSASAFYARSTSERRQTGTSSLNIRFTFDQNIAKTGLSEDQFVIEWEAQQSVWILPTDSYSVSQPVPNQLSFNIDTNNGFPDSLRIYLNQSSYNTLLSEQGLQLDGNNNGEPGGTLVYEYYRN